MYMKSLKWIVISLLIGLSCYSPSWSKDIIVIPHPEQPKQEKEALIILIGLGSKTHDIQDIADFYSNKGYDLFIPDYISRKSIAKCESNLNQFIEKQSISNYEKVHVFSYIIGNWTLNQWLTTHSLTNLKTIVYDRSPLQERAPYALNEDVPFLARLVIGKILREFVTAPYPPIVNSAIRKGILIETKPTELIIKRKKTAAKLGKIDWSVESLKQHYDDFTYVPLNHDEFYTTFDCVSEHVFSFIEKGVFSSKKSIIAPTIDPLTN